jgi:hypothetical protein
VQLLVVHMPPAQLMVVQSAGTPQCWPCAHFNVHTPPQSTSVSLPFFLPSLQLGPAQTPPEHEAEAQSLSTRQPEPTEQRNVQVAPPQSMSVSVPSRLPLVQLAACVHLPLVHTPVEQSDETMQPRVGMHLAGQLPPQSTSVSSLSSRPSKQCVAPHMPSEQASPPGQTTPKHDASAQAPLAQTWPLGHCRVPQLVETHDPPRQPWPAAQLTPTQARSAHRPLEQICEAAHVAPLQVLS